MKKQIGIALLGLVGSGVAQVASAQETSVTVYGRAHVSFESLKASGTKTKQVLNNNTSRIGFRGEEALGNGLKAFFQIESGVKLDDGGSGGSNALAGRESFVGLKSNFGSIKAGNFYHPYDDLHSISGNYFQLFTGTSNDATLWANGSTAATGGFDQRLPNAVSYESPTFGGLSAKLWYSFGPTSGSQEQLGSNGARAISANVLYANGPLKAAWGHLQQRRMQTHSASFYEDGFSNFITVGYQIGPVYLAALVERDKLKNINQSGNDRTRNYGHLLAKYTTGAHTVGAFYGKAYDWKGSAGRDDSGARMYTVGYNYALSKRTQVYTLYTNLKNQDAGAYVLGGSPVRAAGALADWATASEKQSGIVLGMAHNF
ncbi:porin [Aromatoleum diolicum]|uniref:Porin n=1 Tax=Aromatoleum diolicum TaxID=75796 RepID=A0ABX1Q8P2_9RHOO|nr:porin [Aromatoleum diolicum]NMG74658.1 porin [Aromatoleum diolicum]